MRKGEGCHKVVFFKIHVVGEDFLLGHAATEEFEEGFDRVAKAAHAGLAVADVRGGGDSGEEALGVHGG